MYVCAQVCVPACVLSLSLQFSLLEDAANILSEISLLTMVYISTLCVFPILLMTTCDNLYMSPLSVCLESLCSAMGRKFIRHLVTLLRTSDAHARYPVCLVREV